MSLVPMRDANMRDDDNNKTILPKYLQNFVDVHYKSHLDSRDIDETSFF